MRKQQTSDYIDLGIHIQLLMGVWTGSRVHDPAGASTTLERSYELLEKLDLVVSRRLATYIGLDAMRDRLAATDDDAVLVEDDAKRLRETAAQLRPTVMAEAGGLFAYVAEDKRLNVDRLLEHPAKLFPPDIFERLSTMARTDVSEGFKCIALERPTAAAFHLMRAVEESLRNLHHALIGPAEGKKLMWHGMTESLRRQPDPPSDELLAQLDHIRRNFRNPTQHPDATYEIDEAEDLAFLSIDVLSRLLRAMPVA